jgi:hypothetical protein
MASKPTKSATPTKAASKPAPRAAKPAPKKAAKPPASGPAAIARERGVERQLEKAEHAHQDPRGPAHQHNPAAEAHGSDPRKDTIKTRGVPRMNKVVNWFRRGKGR